MVIYAKYELQAGFEVMTFIMFCLFSVNLYMLDNIGKIFRPDPYRVFGDLAPTIQKEGWRPISFGASGNQFIPGYNAAGKNVMIDGKPTGVVVMNVKNNGATDILIRDTQGKHPDFVVKQDITPAQAHDYFVNNGSTIQQRVNDLIAKK